MASKPGTVESLLECPICLSDFTDPRILPCLHTLCRGCLEGHVLASGQGHKFSCPSCRHECQIPKGGLSAMPKNFLLNSLRELLQQPPKKVTAESDASSKLIQSGEFRECDMAVESETPHGKVTVFCVSCAEFYCESCESSHRKFRATRGHQLKLASEIDTATMQASKRQARMQTCEQHPTQPMNLYCDTCSVPVCTTCCMVTHLKHDYRELATVAQEFVDKLTELDKAAAMHTEKLSKHLEELQMSQKDFFKDVHKAHQDVDKAADEMVDLVNQRRQYLHQQIDKIEESTLAEIKATCKETELNKASIESLKSYIQALQVTGDMTDQVVHTPGLQKQLHQQQMVPLHAVAWKVNFEHETNSGAALEAMLGTVGEDRSPVTTPSTIAGDTEQDKLSNSVQTVSSPFEQVEAIAVVGDTVCAAGWQKTYLWLWNRKLDTTSNYNIRGLSAMGVAAIVDDAGQDTLVVTNRNDKLHFVRLCRASGQVTNHRSRNLRFEPRQVKVDSRSKKLIIVNFSEKELAICDYSGKVERYIKTRPELDEMCCAVRSEEMYVVLSNPDLEPTIRWMDSSGKAVHVYGNRSKESLSNPNDMVSDSLGRLLVVDTDRHKLLLIGTNKQLSCHLLTKADGIRNPTAVCLDESASQLYVACRDLFDDYVIKIYKWPSRVCTHHTMQVKLGRHKCK